MSNGSQIGGVVGGVVGGIIGFYTGNVAQGVQWGYAIGSAVGGYVDPTRTYGPRLEDASAQTSTVGGPIPFGYGTFTVAGNIIWADALVEHKKTERVGKGGSEKQTTYTYTRSYAIGVCEGVISAYIWIKKNGKLIYAANPSALGATMGWDSGMVADLVTASSEFRGMATLYYGTEDQMPDSTIEAVEGVGNVSPFRDLAYIVLENEDLTDMQGAVSQYEFCVTADGISYGTSPPYPLHLEEALQSRSAPGDGFFWLPPVEALGSVSTVVGGELRVPLQTYEDWPVEALQSQSTVLDGEIRSIMRTYTAPPEALQSSSTVVEGTIQVILVTYDGWPTEALQSNSTILHGTLT